MSAKFAKGDRVGIAAGRQGKEMRGEVFWIGESRFGKGARYGVRGDDGATYWIDEAQLGPEESVPAPELPQASSEPLAKGTRVRIVRGEHEGRSGEIFWVGASRYGNGSRYGVRDEAGVTYWIDGPGVEALEGAPPAGERDEPESAASPPMLDDAPLPDDDDLGYFQGGEENFPDDEDLPF